MKIIRKNTFETNSSSTHAIAIPKVPCYMQKPHVDFKWGEFGWEYEVYYDTASKASYLYTMIRYFNGEYIPEYNKYYLYLETIKKYLDEENITYSFEPRSDNTWGDGYVDHGCNTPDVVEGILKTKESFLAYLFDERAYVSTGNDNNDGYYIPTSKDEYTEYDMYYKGN